MDEVDGSDPLFATRRDRVEQPAATVEDDLVSTRREGAARAAQPCDEPLVTRRTRPAPSDIFIVLPTALGDRFSVVRELDPGAEADVLLVSDEAEAPWVVKLYRRGIHADREIWNLLGSLRSPQVIRIAETGEESGRDYELMEYLPAGNLLELRSPGAGLDGQVLRAVVAEICEGLAALHAVGIVHCDLKPENVLIRAGGPEDPAQPLQLALTDFGLSRKPEQSMVAASRSGTVAYLAPELFLSVPRLSKARDWWALGVIVWELTTGRRPFEGMTAQGVEFSVLMDALDLDSIPDERIRLLCRGLLTRQPDRRWGATQVQEWARGLSPEVAAQEERATSSQAPAFRYDGVEYTDRRALAAAFAGAWQDATRRYLVGAGKPDPPQSWVRLRGWLQEIDDSDGDALEELLDQRLCTELAPDLKMVYLLQWLDPDLPAQYRGVDLDPAGVARLAYRATDPQAPDHDRARALVEELWTRAALPALATMAGGSELQDVQSRWTRYLVEYGQRAAALWPLVPPVDRPPTDDWFRATLLACAADRQVSDQIVATASEFTRTANEQPVWFQQLVAATSAKAVDGLVVAYVAPRAQAEMVAVRNEKAARRAQWEQSETARAAGVERAKMAALKFTLRTGIIPLANVVLLILLSSQFTSPSSGRVSMMVVSTLVFVAVMAGILLSENKFAGEVGGDYGTFGARYQNPIGWVAARMAGLGCLLIGLAAVILGPLLISFPPIIAVGVGIAYWRSLLRRRRAWQFHHAEQRRVLLGEGV